MVASQVLIAAYVVAALLPLAFVPFILRGRDKAGATGLLVIVVASVLYATASIIGPAGNTEWHWFVSNNLLVLGASIGAIGYLLIAGEYTDTFELRPWIFGVLFLEPLVTQIFAWTNNSHHLIYERGTAFTTYENVSNSYAEFFWVHTVVAYAVLLCGCVLFVREALRSQGVRRTQSLVLTLAAVPPGVTTVITTFTESVTFNPTPFGLIVMVGILSWALLREQFLDIVPVARRTAIENIDDALVTLDQDNRVIDANRAARELFVDDYVGMAAADFFSRLPASVRGTLTEAVDIETQISVTLDGEQRHFSVSVSPVEGEARVILFRDITAQKRRELQLEGYESLFEESSDCIVKTEYVDDEPIIRSVNTAFEEVFGYQEVDLLGKSIDDVIVPDRYREEAKQINEQERNLDDINREVTRQTADGERDFLLRTVHYQDGQSYAIYTDITERKERERELRRQNDRLDQFASVVSHDLRNPLNAAQLRFDLIREDAPPEHATAVERNLDRMETMIDDLLTLAQSGQTVETTEQVALAETATEAWSHLDAGESGLDLAVADDYVIHADRERLLHIFENLFRNALDHNERPVTVRVGTTESAQTDGDRTGFFVEDDGAGIPDENRGDIFEHGHTTNDGGTGFGLSIVEEIVEAHDWTIQATDSESGGARFEITGVERGQ